jgi:PPOX class probable F420-dependent enzyme
MQLTAPLVEALLDAWPVARLATLDRDGRPHAVPIVFARCEGALWSPVDGKPKSGRELARVAAIRRDPRVSLLLDHYDADWNRLWWLRVDGEARVVEPLAVSEVAPVVGALRAKYPQYEEIPVLVEPATLLRVQPASVRSWCAGRDALAAAERHLRDVC